ncbi:hypothetical protein G3M48_004225 [Beauveria asiatica]|uniref:DUF1748-domain-containing protein n=1 Tax=Beauveria asiatica TaxID=1069075 RepID=A0AAW0RTX8_9HYPO
MTASMIAENTVFGRRRYRFWTSQNALTPTVCAADAIGADVVGRLTHYAFDAVIISAFLAGMKRSTGLTIDSFKTEKVAGDNKEANKWINKYLGLGEWVMDQSVAIAGSSSFFERTR